MIAFIFRPLADALFPRSLERAAGILGTVCLVLAVCVAAFFPVSAHAGTEVPAARWITAGALAVAWIALQWSGGRLPVVGAAVAVLVAAALAAPASWLLLFAAGCCVYAAISMVPRAAAQPAAADADPPATETQELLESVALALVLALVVREFGFEAFKIPTGSMFPTIMGDEGGRHGDRLLAFKAAEIRRWDITVFRFPLFRNTNYIKRTIGLPGEDVELRDGDVYVNGKIAPKPDDVQEVMWRRAASPKPDEEWVESFDPDTGNAWVLRKGYAEVDAEGGGGEGAPEAGVAWLQAQASYEEDFRVSFDVELTGPATAGDLLVSLDGGRRQVDLDLGPSGAKVTVPGAECAPPIGALADFGTRFRLGVSMSDRVVRIWRDGRQVWRFEHPDVSNGGLDQGKFRIGAKNLKAVVRNVVVENDVQYSMVQTTKWKIPEGCYVMLGDNTWSSRDSRYWTANVVRTLDGREFVAPDTARVTEEREETVFRPHPDGSVDFIDSYGVPRHFAKDEIEPVRRNVPLPFVKQDDLVGRAFFIFFPFPPFGDFRPRLLR